jgi:hypothetical protein
MFAKVVLLSALISSAVATVFITEPTSASTFNGGATNTITWQDDGNSPSLASWGNASVSIYTGNANQQTLLQTVVASINVSSTSTIQFTADPSIGPNAAEYFIRIESLTLVNPNNTFNQMSFSHLFTMANMTGSFDASISAEINGQSTAPIGGSTTGSTASSTAGSNANAAAASSTSSSATTSATTAAPSNGAMGMVAAPVWGCAILSVVALTLMQ